MKRGPGFTDDARRVVQQRHADFLAQRFRLHFHQFAQALDQPGQVDQRAEYDLRVARRTIPEHDVEFVLEKTRHDPFCGGADELTELGFRYRRLRPGLFGHPLLRLLGLDISRQFLLFCAASRIVRITVRLRRSLRRVAPFLDCPFLVFLLGLREVDRALRTVPVNLDAFAAGEESFVVEEEPVCFGTSEQLRRRVARADVRQRPVLAQALVERTGRFNRLVVGQQRFDLSRKLALMFRQQSGRLPGDGIGHTLVEQRLLAFEHKLLVAQRADREPGQHEARHKHGQHKHQRNLFH